MSEAVYRGDNVNESVISEERKAAIELYNLAAADSSWPVYQTGSATANRELVIQRIESIINTVTARQLETELNEAHAVLDDPECLIIRNAKDGYPEGRPDQTLTLTERVMALLRMKMDYKRWMEKAEQELGQLRAQLLQAQADISKETERADDAEEALREICILNGFDPSDGEGTSPKEVVEVVRHAQQDSNGELLQAQAACRVKDEALEKAQHRYRVTFAINTDQLTTLKTPYDEALSYTTPPTLLDSVVKALETVQSCLGKWEYPWKPMPVSSDVAKDQITHALRLLRGEP